VPGACCPLPIAMVLVPVLVVLFLHYFMAVLVLLPETRPLRLAMLPIALGLPYYAATRYDVSNGDLEFQSHGYNYTVRSPSHIHKNRASNQARS
jgi:hypothetical protein